MSLRTRSTIANTIRTQQQNQVRQTSRQTAPAEPKEKTLDQGAKSHAGYKNRLRDLDDEALAAEAARLTALVGDAAGGVDKKKGVENRSRVLLAEVTEELGARKRIAASASPEYAMQVHQMDNKELAKERHAWTQKLRQANKGPNPDPDLAATAKAHLEILDPETTGRVRDRHQGKLPGVSHSKTRPLGADGLVRQLNRYEGMTPEELATEKGKVMADYNDATTGPIKDSVHAANAQKKLDLISQVETMRAPPEEKVAAETVPASSLRGPING